MRAAILVIATLLLTAAAGPPPSLQSLLRDRVRYVFVIYQENRSFDHYFGTFPGADGIYTDAARAHGFSQYNPIAKRQTAAFRVTTPDLGLLNNARTLVDSGINDGKMDRFVAAEIAWAQKLPPKAQQELGMTDPSELASIGDESMAHVDCDTIPYLWMYASRFALYDSFFQGARAPSSPSNVEIIAAQNGETEYKKYGAAGPPYTADPKGAGGRGVPMFVDLDPAWGPYNTKDSSAEKQVDQTYATVLLNLEGAQAGGLKNYTQDIGDDIAFLRGKGDAAVNWTWYQQGYNNPADPGRTSLVTHHLAPHYFGYIANNASMDRGVADITQFASDVAAGKLGDSGLFYLKGGFAQQSRASSSQRRAAHLYRRRRPSGRVRSASRRGRRRAAGQHHRAQQILEPIGDRHHLGRSGRLLGSRAAAVSGSSVPMVIPAATGSACRCC